MRSVFSDEQNAVRRKKYFVLVTMNPEAIGTSEFNTIDRKKFQIRQHSLAGSSQAKNVRTSFETLDTRLLDALCDADTKGIMMSDSTRNGSEEKNPG